MTIKIFGSADTIIEINLALMGVGPSELGFAAQMNTMGANNANAVAYTNTITEQYSIGMSDDRLAQVVLNNMLGNDPANSMALSGALAQLFAANEANRGVVICQLGRLFENLETDVTFGHAAGLWNTRVYTAYVATNYPVIVPTALDHESLDAKVGLVGHVQTTSSI